MTQKQLLEEVDKIFADVRKTLANKNSDYSGEDSDAFANFWDTADFAKGILPAEFVESTDPATLVIQGMLYRIGDKYARFKTLVRTGEQAVMDESIHDTLRDLVGYNILLAVFVKSLMAIYDFKLPEVPEVPAKMKEEKTDPTEWFRNLLTKPRNVG